MTFYIKNNSESTKNAFNKKIIYKNAATQLNVKNIIDFSMTEKALYGKVSRDGVPIIMIAPGNLKKTKNSSDSNRSPVSAFNFVIDVFDLMCLEFQKKAQEGKIYNGSEFLTTINAYKGYTNPVSAYNDYRTIYNKILSKAFKSTNFKPENFETFVKQLLEVVKFTAQDVRYTLPGFVKSTSNSPLNSGLAIEIASNLKYANDQDKIDQFITDPNWAFYVQTCNSHGFMIDMNTPWRIVADLDSKIMKQYSGLYGFGNVEAVLTEGFNTAYSHHFFYFIDDLLELYNIVRSKTYTKTYVCEDGTVKTEKVHSKKYTKLSLYEEFGSEFFLSLYINLRIIEEMPDAEQNYINQITREVMGYSKTGLQGKLENFEILINKEVDKIGSFNYIIKQATEIAESDFESGESSAISSY